MTKKHGILDLIAEMKKDQGTPGPDAWFDPFAGKWVPKNEIEPVEIELPNGRCRAGRLKDLMFVGTEFREPLDGEDVGLSLTYAAPGAMFESTILIVWSKKLSIWFSCSAGRDPEKTESLSSAIPEGVNPADRDIIEARFSDSAEKGLILTEIMEG